MQRFARPCSCRTGLCHNRHNRHNRRNRNRLRHRHRRQPPAAHAFDDPLPAAPLTPPANGWLTR